MINLFGTGIGNQIEIGHAYVMQGIRHTIEAGNIDETEVKGEIKRLKKALARTRQQLNSSKQQIPSDSPIEGQTIIDAHLLMLQDPMLVDETIRLIEQELWNAESAVEKNAQSLMSIFGAMDDPYLRNKKQDVYHLTNLILNALLNIKDHSFAEVQKDELDGKIIISSDIGPAEAVHITNRNIASFVTDFGGPISHTAIIAKSLNIPAVVGLENATQFIRDNDLLIIDSALGVVLVNPDEKTVTAYKERRNRLKRQERELKRLVEKSCTTRQGEEIKLLVNAELPREIKQAKKVHADGVGLFRTEYLFMDRDQLPSEQEQFSAYRKIVKSMGKRVAIRTLDIGADKQLSTTAVTSNQLDQRYSALGLRAVRLCLQNRELFIPQLRSILRASAYGKVDLMIPMLSHIEELNQVLSLIDETKKELRREKIKFDNKIKIGAMIEVPAAALNADAFAERLDFLSIGTNDLIQYTLAIDRVDQSVNYLYDPLHPSVLKLIKMTIDAGHRAGIPVSLCGEMAANPDYTKLLIGLGLRTFSTDTTSLLAVKKQVLHTDTDQVKSLIDELLHCQDPQQSRRLLDELNKTSELDF